jgi:CheY-like chemotaxis protein
MKESDHLVLIAEDDPHDLQLVKRAFEACNFNCIIDHVRDGQDAMDYLERRNKLVNGKEHKVPDLLITDLEMPRVDGLELVKWLREHEELTRIPVIVITGSSLDNPEKEMVEGCANAFLSKEIIFHEPQKFIETVQKLVAD